MGGLKTIPLSEQVNILMQEVSRLHEENIKIRQMMMEIVDATQQGFLMLNEDIVKQ